MALYLLALTDSAVRVAGLRALLDLDVDGIHAICERRSKVPPLTDDVLREQHAIIMTLARHTHAILPARYGALMAKEELAKLVRVHEADIRRALNEVRDRVQMTVRVLGVAPARASGPVSSGRQYLEERRRAASPVLPPAAESLLASLGALVVRERREYGTHGVLATIYHLIDASQVSRYDEIVTRMTTPKIVSSGPWPPFAFTPRLV